MGMIIIALIIMVIVAGLSALVTESFRRVSRSENAVFGGLVSGIVLGVIIGITFLMSYGSYVTIRTSYDGVVGQYRGAVEMYVDYATIDMGKAATFTDFKYKGYQENVATFIKALRTSITKYNSKLISKRILKKNFFFNWFIVAPDDDMKVINIITRERKGREKIGENEAEENRETFHRQLENIINRLSELAK